MKRGFASWELRGTDVLTLGCGARLGLHLPLCLGPCHCGPSSDQALPCMSRAGRAGPQSAQAGLRVGWQKVRVSERGGGDVSIVVAWSVHALGVVQHLAEVPVLALDQALMDPRYTLLACNALGTFPWPGKGLSVLPTYLPPRQGTPCTAGGDQLWGRPMSFT